MPKAVAHVCSYIYVWNKSSCNGNSSLFTYDHRPFRQSCMRRQMLEEKKRKLTIKRMRRRNFLSSIRKEERKKMRKRKGEENCVLFQH